MEVKCRTPAALVWYTNHLEVLIESERISILGSKFVVEPNLAGRG